MGLFNFFRKHRDTAQDKKHAVTSTGMFPSRITVPESLQLKDIIMLSIRCKANEFKKLNPRHIRTINGAQEVITTSSVARLLKRPNSYMTQSDFLECITILLELNRNVYIYPEHYVTQAGETVYTEMYPLRPNNVEMLQDASGALFYRMTFNNGYVTTLKAEKVIHWKKDYGIDEYFGGNGWSDVAGLQRAVSMYDTMIKSIAKAMQISCNVNGVVKINSIYSDEKQKAEEEAFKKKLENNESGVLFTDLKTEYVNMSRDIKLVDSETVKFLYENILRFNGTSLPILNGDYTKAQKEAYYEHALEADIKSLGEAMSRVFFTDREMSFGNEIVFYPHLTNFMSMENKLSALQTGLPAGLFTINEGRALLGYPPVKGGDELRPRGYNNLDSGNDSTLTQDEDEGDNAGDEVKDDGENT